MKVLRVFVFLAALGVFGEWMWVLISTVLNDIQIGEIGYFGIIALVFCPMAILAILSFILVVLEWKKAK